MRAPRCGSSCNRPIYSGILHRTRPARSACPFATFPVMSLFRVRIVKRISRVHSAVRRRRRRRRRWQWGEKGGGRGRRPAPGRSRMRYLAGSITSRPGRDDARDPETRFVSFLIFVQLHRERACEVGGDGRGGGEGTTGGKRGARERREPPTRSTYRGT